MCYCIVSAVTDIARMQTMASQGAICYRNTLTEHKDLGRITVPRDGITKDAIVTGGHGVDSPILGPIPALVLSPSKSRAPRTNGGVWRQSNPRRVPFGSF